MMSGLACVAASGARLRELPAYLTQFGALAGDHLAEQPTHEQHAPHDHARLDEVQQRPESNAGEDANGERHDAREYAQREEHGTHHAEEQERLLREAELEPDREHVERAHRNASDAELGFSGVTRVERYRDLRH